MTMFAILAAATFSAGPESFDAFFAEFAKKRAGVNTLVAQFDQTIATPEDKYTTQGILYFEKPRRILFHTNEPDRSTLVENRRGYEYEPEIKQLQIFDIEENPRASIFFLGFDDDTTALRASYEVSLFNSSDDPRGAQGILIRPKKDDDNPYFVEVRLSLREQDYLPYRIHIVNDEETQTIIDIKSFTVNEPLDPVKSRIQAAEGTKIIQDEQVIETVGPGGKRIPDDLKPAPEAAPEAAVPPVQINELPPPAPAESAP